MSVAPIAPSTDTRSRSSSVAGLSLTVIGNRPARLASAALEPSQKEMGFSSAHARWNHSHIWAVMARMVLTVAIWPLLLDTLQVISTSPDGAPVE